MAPNAFPKKTRGPQPTPWKTVKKLQGNVKPGAGQQNGTSLSSGWDNNDPWANNVVPEKVQANVKTGAGQQNSKSSSSGWDNSDPWAKNDAGKNNKPWIVSVEEPKGNQTNKWEDDPWSKPVVKTRAELLKEQIEMNLQFWPWRDTVPRKLVTLAPFLLNNLRDSSKYGQPFEKPEVKQTCLLFKIMNNDIIRQTLVELLFVNHDTAWKFAATSRNTWHLIKKDIVNWDFTRGGFGDCDIARFPYLDPEHLIALADKPVLQGFCPSIIIVSPVRGPKVTPKDIQNQESLRETTDQHLYEDQLNSMHKMCTAMSNYADFFQNLQLHRIPFLTTEILELVVPLMRNLKVLGIYKCQLIHVGDTMKLLEIIQVDKVIEKQNQVKLDFYPNYHVGAISFPGYEYATGSFGVTWDNWNGDSRLSIWQLVSVIFPRAQAQKQDLWSPHTMFRQWLDKTPCWRVEDTLATIWLPEGDERSAAQMAEDFVVMVDSPDTGGSVTKFKSNRLYHPEGWAWKLESFPCTYCERHNLGIFYFYDDIRQLQIQGLTPAQMALRCMGCRLVSVLDAERDHYKGLKRGIIAKWLSTEDEETKEQVWNTNDMPKALKDFKERQIARLGRSLDIKRITRMRHPTFPLDKEHDEVQLPLQKHEKLKLGMKLRSPTVQSKDPVFDEWNSVRMDKQWRHGHGI